MVKIESFSEAIFGFVIKMAIKDRIRRLKNDITYGQFTTSLWIKLHASINGRIRMCVKLFS